MPKKHWFKFDLKRLQLDELLFEKEIAEKLNITRMTLYTYCQRGAVTASTLAKIKEVFGTDKASKYYGGAI